METYYVSVEEFVPRINVRQMLEFTEALEKMDPVEAKQAFKDLKRALVWMERYIIPTSEFWEWTNDTFKIDSNTQLMVQLIGFGWAIAISSIKPVSIEEICGEEKRLINIMDLLTKHIPVKGVLRMKSTHWTHEDIENVLQLLTMKGVQCKVSNSSLVINEVSATIQFEPEERLDFTGITREKAKIIEDTLLQIKEYANRKLEGSSWCSYNRRRLTLVRKVGQLELTAEEKRFIEHPEYGMSNVILTSKVKISDTQFVLFTFPRARYHLGNIHPRAIIAVEDVPDGVKELTTYIYYLWNSHYTRIWLYLLFEDIYAYASSLLASGQYIDPKIVLYWQNLLRTDEIIAEMETHERVNQGEFQSYAPPHKKFLEQDTPATDPLEWLRNFLIEATTTQLYEDPLKRAVKLLIELDKHMKTALNLFIQQVDIRIQKSLQILQILFIIAAVGQIVQLLNLSDPFQNIIRNPLISRAFPNLLRFDILNLILNILLILIFTVVFVWVLKLEKIKKLIENMLK